MTIEATVDVSRRAELDRLVETHLRAQREGEVETILDALTDDVEHELLGAADNPVHGKDAKGKQT